MTDVPIPGGRDVRATLEEPRDDRRAVRIPLVVACPPHPQHGGHRGDRRLVAVADRLREAGIACLRIDYGAWDGGYGEREDVRNAIRWAADRDDVDAVGAFGYSFGASQALLASATVDRPVAAVSALAPTARLDDDSGDAVTADSSSSPRTVDGDGLDAVAALESLACPVQVCYGERDDTVAWDPVVERARSLGHDVAALPSDHFFVGQDETIAETVGGFFRGTLLE